MSVRASASRNSSDTDFERAVDAIISGNLPKLKKLLAANPDLIRARSTRTHHATLLHYTSANGVEDFRQKTPKNIVAITDFLLNSGSEVDATADMYGGGATTLGLVVTSVHPFQAGVQNDLADVLLKHGAHIDHPQGAGNGQPPINGCFANGRPEAAEHLAKRGARLDLEAAAGIGDLNVVKNFFTPAGELKKGATDSQLKSGFKWACAYGRIEVAKFLLQTNIDINVLHRGETPLHWAAYSGNLEIVRLLLKHKARTDIKDQSFNGTALGWALYAWGESQKTKREKYYPIVETLVAAGATIDPNWLNETDRGYPLDKMIANDSRMAKVFSGQLNVHVL